MVAPPITFEGDRMSVHFDTFDLPAYDLFLRVKNIPEYALTFDPEGETYTVTAPARFAEMLGVERPAGSAQSLPLSPFLYDDQAYIVPTALEAKRYAVWSDCGGGKTVIGLEYARHVIHRTDGRVLIVTLNEIVPQWIAEAATFYGDSLPVVRLNTREQMKEWCRHGTVDGVPTIAKVGITNYEKFNHKGDDDQNVAELRHLAGLVLDEASRLKCGGGKQKWAVIKSGKGIEYKLALTATPAPNEPIEFASQASFLEKMRSDNEIIWTYFARDPDTQEWTVKPHARKAFFEFMSSWSIYVRDPKRYGWRLNLPDVPPPKYIRLDIEPTAEQRTEAARIMATPAAANGQQTLISDKGIGMVERNKLSQVAKGFVYLKGKPGDKKGTKKIRRIPSNKPATVARIVADEVATGSQVLVWTVFDGESKELAKQLGREGVEYELLTGATAEADRAATLDRFRDGQCRVLVSRASLLGFGMNFQMCSAMVFSGWTDSYESFYQAVRRAVRHGQAKRVRVYLPCVRDLEDETLANLDRKAAQMEQAISEMETQYVRVLSKGERR
ncbi:MAG: hypothetical protein C0467_06055 [Planctomycetaceae bacterium]|nr:hypothetical protein [Planctomycetaceae bacterium]